MNGIKDGEEVRDRINDEEDNDRGYMTQSGMIPSGVTLSGVTLCGVTAEDVTLEVIDISGSAHRVMNWRVRNPCCLSFNMPGTYIRRAVATA